jgi:uncharacterized membrane protein YgdD (TMEM256/DUF423 family)
MPGIPGTTPAHPDRAILLTGLANGLVAVLVAATAAHGPLAPTDIAAQRQVDTASLLHFVHTLGLMLLAFWPNGAVWRRLTALAWLGGILLFCGSIYSQVLLGWPWPGPSTPIGGLLLMVGWLAWMAGLMGDRRG